jgi:outer membrane receptor protein involved in Fe transport
MPAAAPGSIGGTVVNAAGEPVASAAVTIRSAADSALVGGALAKADGSFRIEGLRPGRYHVRLRALGYAALVKRDVVVRPDAPRADLGRLALAPVATQLSGVKVEAEREEVALAPDRNSYATKDMPATAGGTAVDVLRNVPAVEVDGDNAISLRGNGSVVVQINGRVSPMRGQQLGNYLAQLPANLVAKVEVVANPSAKNDPDGMAGIINIVLKQQTDLGTSGGFTAGGGSTGQANVSGNLGHQQGKWTLFSSYGFFNDRRTIDGWSERTTLFTPENGSPGLASDIQGTMRPQSHSFTGTVEYKAGKKDVIGNNLVANRRTFSRDNDALYRTLDAAGVVTSRNDQLTDQAQKEANVDYALTWKRTMVPQKHTLSTEVRYNLIDGTNDVHLSSDLLRPDRSAMGPRQLETNLTDERQHALFAQTDWTRQLRPSTKLETGYKGIFRQQRSDFDVAQAEGTGGFIPDLGRSNAFTYRENVQAVYGLLSQRVGTVDLQGGLRLEQADAVFNLTTTGEKYDIGYKSAFPSAIASYNLDANRQIKASYSKRIQRPDVRQLNPFGFREDALNIFQGNPGLRPEYTHAYELGYQQTLPKGRGSIQLTPFYRHTINAVRQIGSVNDEGVLRVSFANAATSDSYGTDANVTFKMGKLNLFGGGTVFGQETKAANIAGARDVSAFGWSTRANATYKLTPKLDAQGFVMYRAPQKTEQGRMASFSFLNVALKQKLRGDNATATLRVMDPLGTMGWRIEASDGRVIQLMDRRFGARGAFLSFNYTFGKPPKIKQPQGSAEPLPAGPGMGPG